MEESTGHEEVHTNEMEVNNDRGDDVTMERRRLELDQLMLSRQHLSSSKSKSNTTDEVLKTLQKLLDETTKSLDVYEQSIGAADEEKVFLANLKSLETRLSEEATIIASYDLKILQKAMEGLRERLRGIQETKKPRKKFGFKNKRSAATTLQPNTTAATTTSPSTKTTTTGSRASLVLSGRRNEKDVVVEADQADDQDVLLADLQFCTVVLKGSPSTLFARDLKECNVSIGNAVKTSCFVERCANSNFFIGCHQLRIHESKKCEFYINEKCRAIIEDSSEMAFASLDENKDAKRLEINDFNWLHNEEKSPNWYLLKKEQRRANPIQ